MRNDPKEPHPALATSMHQPPDPLDAHVRRLAMLIEECAANLRLIDLIEHHADEINQSGFGMSLGYIQTQSLYLAATRISNMFENSSRNKLHSIPHLLRRLRSAPSPNEKVWRHEFANSPTALTRTLAERKRFGTADVLDFVEHLLQRPGLRKRLGRCAKARDTWIAHADAGVKNWPDMYMNDISYPLEWAKHYVSIAGNIWIGVTYGSYDEPFIDMGAVKIAASLKRLLVCAKIIPDDLT